MFRPTATAALALVAIFTLSPAARATTAPEAAGLYPASSTNAVESAPDSWFCSFFRAFPGCPIKKR